jgi:tRNA (cytidine/uridine-2'-O-)-methyltransferase
MKLSFKLQIGAQDYRAVITPANRICDNRCMLHVVLYQPEIPPNTGNVIRLCANTGARLHLIKPLGFTLDDAKMRRAGLDYHEYAELSLHESYDSFVQKVAPTKIYALSTRGSTRHTEVSFESEDAVVFGPETRGLPQGLLDALPLTSRIRLPMLANNRSLNLSNSVAIVVYEAWRQMDFQGAK